MSEFIPDPVQPGADKPKSPWWLWVVSALALCGLLYGVFKAVPTSLSGQSYAKYATGSLSMLSVMKEAPPQPQNNFLKSDGTPTNLSAFRGKVVLLNLWATWCAPCVQEMPTLAALQKTFGGPQFTVLAISVDRDSDTEEAKAELAKLSDGHLDFYQDSKMAIVYPLKARGFPTSILYDREGKEVARLAGEADWNSTEARALIKAALAN